MKRYQVEDVIRENVGRDKITPHMMDWIMGAGLRTIENTGNYYWMQAGRTWTVKTGQQDYEITTKVNTALNLPNWKDTRIIYSSVQGETNQQWIEVIGPKDIEDMKSYYGAEDTGQPRFYSFSESLASGPTLSVWPPSPDANYDMTIYHYEWTSLPADSTSEAHEVLKRWPEALIYTATSTAYSAILKDDGGAAVWMSKFDNPRSPRDKTELTKIRRYNLDRQNSSRIEFTPHMGAATPGRWNLRNRRELCI